MANKQKNQINWNKITQICAFFAIVIAGLIFTINAILKLCEASINFGIFNTISTILLVAALIIPGWRFSKGKPKWVQILFWVAAIVLIVTGTISLV